MSDAKLAKDIIITMLSKCDWETPQIRAEFAEEFVKACVAVPEKIPTERLRRLHSAVHRAKVSAEKAAAVRATMDKVVNTKSKNWIAKVKTALGKVWKAVEGLVDGDSGDDATGSSYTGVRG